MNEWLKVDESAINGEVQTRLRDVNVKVSFSPYDVPRRLRGFWDTHSNLFVIEFEYLLEEKTRPQKSAEDSPIELEIGENSNRIYKIKIDVVRLGCNAIRLEFEPIARDVIAEIEKFKTELPEKQRERFKLPENLVFNRRRELFSPIAECTS